MPRGLAVQLPCPQCRGKNTYVVATFHTDKSQIVRRRHCKSCEHRWYTQQLPEQSLSQYKIKWTKRGTRIIEILEDSE